MLLSRRLIAVANFITERFTVADIGSDHGFLPIYLVESGKCPKALALDINEGPLSRAGENILSRGLNGKIYVRKSDGARELAVGECDCAVIAGMGGALTVKILGESSRVFKSLREIILQPQSEVCEVRRYLIGNGYRIIDEDMVREKWKFYPVIKAVSGSGGAYTETQLKYGKILLDRSHPVLKEFLEKELSVKNNILSVLAYSDCPNARERKEELIRESEEIKNALLGFDEVP